MGHRIGNLLRNFICAVLCLFILSACMDGPRLKMAPGYGLASTEIPDPNIPVIIDTPTVIPPTPTIPPLIVEEQFYSLPSRALEFTPIQDWVMDDEKPYFVDFKAQDSESWFEAAYETTGYTLSTDAYAIYTDNVIASLYIDSINFEIVDQSDDGIRRTYISTQDIDGEKWYALDAFIMRREVMYAFSFNAPEALWERYLPAFIAVYESALTRTGYVTDDLLYKFDRRYYDPGNLFRVKIPMGWTVAEIETDIDNTRMQSVISPDGQGEMKTVIYSPEVVPSSQDVGQTALDLLIDLVAKDVDISGYKILREHNRIRLDWTAYSSNKYGYSYFWREGGEVYLLTFMRDNQHPGIYHEALDDIDDSFKFIEE